jgi:hypothetical protein
MSSGINRFTICTEEGQAVQVDILPSLLILEEASSPAPLH